MHTCKKRICYLTLLFCINVTFIIMRFVFVYIMHMCLLLYRNALVCSHDHLTLFLTLVSGLEFIRFDLELV